MKKFFALALAAMMAASLAGCSSGVSQEEYDAVVAERDALQKQVNQLTQQLNQPSGNIEESVGSESEDITNQEVSIPEGSFNADEVMKQLEITELHYNSGYSDYSFLIIQNNSPFNLDIAVSTTYYDAEGNLIGAKDASQEAVESGYSTLLYFMLDEPYSSMEYELDISEEENWGCVLSDLSYEVSEAKDKIILSVTNNGETAADFVEAYALFFNQGEIVGFNWNYITDDDSEIKPGKTINQEMSCYEAFDSYQIFFTGRR